ncbi:MAG TPA: dTDP-4-dehydrorhamnose 3,5-epimerase [Thermoanaerobaculia bacterium]|nr:dTDP-4-dehydrorhamnose 3,5-epimerase [Thermoanaerobaculia bacterium]
MDFRPLELPGVILVVPDVHPDERGYFLETYHRDKYATGGIPETFVQDNQSFSYARVLRGLHAQLQYPQGKLVRAITGSIFDVAVDIRPGSPSFGRWVGETLSGENARQLYVPPGFAHGFCVLSETAHVQYKCTDVYRPGDEIGVAWNDPEIGIDWPVADPVLNEKDRKAPRLAKIVQRLRSV